MNQKLADMGVKSGDEVSRTRADLQLAIAQMTSEMQKITAQLENTQLRLSDLDRQLGTLKARPANGKADTGAKSAGNFLESTLNTAQEDFARGRFDLAYRGFSDIVARDSSGSLKPMALYKMGECRFAQSNWDEARTLYLKVVREYPKDPARCPAWFKLGLVYGNAKAPKDRDEAWAKLQKSCPGSNEAQRAKDIQTGN
ncbi:MAG TPA: tetratricopeptide repeat protein [Fibrobacteria bacterium]|nr:tetratricopeptide repeat protein [Fibrobacteria bacterium]HOX50788.1 tetratricopeptide repeat protein [Fibrobacteria bacterium]